MVVAFMISGLKHLIPYIVEAIPETTITLVGNKNNRKHQNSWRCMFTVRAVIADNHSTNVTEFSKLLKEYNIIIIYRILGGRPMASSTSFLVLY